MQSARVRHPSNYKSISQEEGSVIGRAHGFPKTRQAARPSHSQKPRQSPSTAIGIPTPRGHRVRDAAKRRQASITAAAQRRLGREQVEGVHVECRRKAAEILKRRVRFAVLDFVKIRPPYPATLGEICLRDPRGPAKAANVGAEHCAEKRRAIALEQAVSVRTSCIHRCHTIRPRTDKKRIMLRRAPRHEIPTGY